MKYLLDTAVFIWILNDDVKSISPKAFKVINEAKLVLSSVVTWEIAIKYSIGKLKLSKSPQKWLPDIITQMGLEALSVNYAHSLAVAELPRYHGDPFDRLLISQAKTEDYPILSPDKIFKKYPVDIVW